MSSRLYSPGQLLSPWPRRSGATTRNLSPISGAKCRQSAPEDARPCNSSTTAPSGRPHSRYASVGPPGRAMDSVIGLRLAKRHRCGQGLTRPSPATGRGLLLAVGLVAATTGPGHGELRGSGVDLGDLADSEGHVGGLDVLGHPFESAAASYRDDARRLRQPPPQRDLARCDLLAAGDLLDQVHYRLVGLEGFGGEAWKPAADVVGGERLRAADGAR